MSNTLDNTILTDTICLAYLDTSTETLKEIDNNFYCTLSPYSNSFYNLYLIGDYIYSKNINISFIIEGNDKVYCKAYAGRFNINKFDDSVNTLTCTYNTVQDVYSNCIPISLRISSDCITENTIALKVVISEVE